MATVAVAQAASNLAAGAEVGNDAGDLRMKRPQATWLVVGHFGGRNLGDDRSAARAGGLRPGRGGMD